MFRSWRLFRTARPRVAPSRKPRLEVLEDRLVPASFTQAQLDSAGEYMLQLINQGRANPTAEAARFGIDLNEGLAAGTISAAAKQPLAPSAALLGVVNAHLAVWLNEYVQNGGPNPHDGLSDGKEADRIYAAGIPKVGYIGYNLASYFGSSAPDGSSLATTAGLQSAVDTMYKNLFVDQNVTGRGHRVNLMNGIFQLAGSGAATGAVPAGNAGAGYDLNLVGQDFYGSTSGNSYLTGVVYKDGNGNGRYDVSEGLGGVTVTVSQGGTVVGTVQTFSAGGYALQLAPGTYTVTISGGGLSGTQTQNVTVGSSNVESDFTAGTGTPIPDKGTSVVAGEFQGAGVWRYEGAKGWQQLTNADATQVAVNSTGDLVGEFKGGGVWRYKDATGWQQLTKADAALVGIDAAGDVVGEFTGAGVWLFKDATGWQQLVNADATQLAIGATGAIVGEFAGGGVWRHEDSTGWQQLTNADATQVAIDAAGDVVGAFGSGGVWRYKDGTGWQQLTTAQATVVAIDAAGDVAGVFKGFGTWEFRDAGGWQQLTTADAARIGLNGAGDLAGVFTGSGAWVRSAAGSWQNLTKADAASLSIG